MYIKLVLRNIKRSLGDYIIYFITLCFAVSMFYVFNAIPFSQSIQSASQKIREAMPIIMNALSVFISIVFGLLLVYANNYIIKRRNKELGIYMLLGMGSSNISIMLFVEMLMLGASALFVGLFSGIFLSQGMAFVVAAIFEQEMEGLKLTVSVQSLSKTILFYLLIFIIAAGFSSWKISKLRIIDLLQAGKKSEKIRFVSPKVSIPMFIVSVIALTVSYMIALNRNFRFNDLKQVVTVLVLGALGTYLFYFSASGFILTLLMRSKKLYYKKLNIFSLRQVANKVTTNTVLIATISVMLLFTVCSFAAGFGLNDFATNTLKRVSPNDFEFSVQPGTDISSLETYMKSKGCSNYSITETGIYSFDVPISKAITSRGLTDIQNENANAAKSISSINFIFIKLSEYNSLRKARGFDPIELKNGSIALHAIVPDLKKYFTSFTAENGSLNINGATLKAKDVYDERLIAGNELAMAVINDEDLSNTAPSYKIIAVVLNQKYDEKLSNSIVEQIKKYNPNEIIARYNSLQDLYGVSALAIFAGLYIGITFLIMSATILALQQLTDASGHKHKFDTLKKIGADRKMLDGSVLIQTGVYFLAPMALTIINGTTALKTITNNIKMAGGFSVTKTILFTAAVFAIFYGIYFSACSSGFKRILKTKDI